MTPDALIEILARVGASHGAGVFIGSQELDEWPATLVASMKAQKLVVKARPAVSVVCPGCERECVMSVHIVGVQPNLSRAFIVCDKRSDINRVAVPVESLEQWQASGEAVAELLAFLLGVRRPNRPANPERWEIGMFKGAKHASHLVLLADGELKLTLAGHSIAVADVLEVKSDHLWVDRRALTRLVDQPVAGAGDPESAVQRRERLKTRVSAEKAKGTRAFLKVVAAEEGISASRLKQIVKEDAAPAKMWPGASPQSKGPISTAGKTKR